MVSIKLCRLMAIFILSSMLPTISESTSSEDEGEADIKNRMRREVGGSGAACMQIYTVPKREVMCDPSPEVQDSLEDMDGRLSGYQSKLDTLNAKLDGLDPDKPKELSEEIKDKLSTIENVREKQAANVEILKRLDTDIESLKSRIGQVESTERLQVAQMVETQTTLIKAAMHQSNISLHDAYLDKLAENTDDLTQKIANLEGDLVQKVEASVTKTEVDIENLRESNQRIIDLVKERLVLSVDVLDERLKREIKDREEVGNETVSNKESLERVDNQLTNIREHQARYESHEAELRRQIEDLSGRLDKERAEKEQLSEKTNGLSRDLTGMKSDLTNLFADLSSAVNETSRLRKELASLKEQIQRKEHLLPKTIKVSDCQDALAFYYPTSGVYVIDPALTNRPVEVFCEMHEGEGWTFLQRRHDGRTNFFRGWTEYKQGFGDPAGEYWIGLQTIRELTARRAYTLKVELQDWEDRWHEANYDVFSVEDEADSYRLHVGDYHGDAGDSLVYHNGMPFSTMDRNNDQNNGICATWCRGAWWYKDCFHSNLNGHYYQEGPYVTKTGWGDGVVWRHIQGTNFYSLKSVVMKIRPLSRDN